MAELKDTKAPKFEQAQPPAAPKELVRLGEFQLALSGLAPTGHTHPYTDIPNFDSGVSRYLPDHLGDSPTIQWVNDSGVNSPGVVLAPTGGLEEAADGVRAKFGTGVNDVARGSHTHSGLHDAVTLEPSQTLDWQVNEQHLMGEVRLGGPGLQATPSGIVVDFGPGHDQIPRGDHTHSGLTQLHDPVTLEPSETLEWELDAQKLRAEVRTAGDGWLVTDSGLGHDIGTGHEQIARGDHTHSGLQTPLTFTSTATVDLVEAEGEVTATLRLAEPSGFATSPSGLAMMLRTLPGLLLDTFGLGADFGTGEHQVARGSHTHSGLHNALTLGTSFTIDWSLLDQQLSAEVRAAEGGGLLATYSGLMVDWTEVARAHHEHEEFHDPVTVHDTDTVGWTQSGQHFWAVVRLNENPGFMRAPISEDSSGLYLQLGTSGNQPAAGDHTHPYATAVLGGYLRPEDKAKIDGLVKITVADTPTVDLTLTGSGLLAAEVKYGPGFRVGDSGVEADAEWLEENLNLTPEMVDSPTIDFTTDEEAGTVTGVVKYGQGLTVGSSGLEALALPATTLPAPIEIGAGGATGVSTRYARADHEHPAPALADEAEDGFMSAEDYLTVQQSFQEMEDPTSYLGALRVELPMNLSGLVNPQTGGCRVNDTMIATAGQSGRTYAVKIRIRGVMEPKNYAGGTVEGKFQRGGTYANPSDGGYNAYRLKVTDDDGDQIFYLNSGAGYATTFEGSDYVAWIRVSGRGRFELRADSINGGQIVNSAIVIPGIPPSPAAYYGQFVQMDCVRVKVFGGATSGAGGGGCDCIGFNGEVKALVLEGGTLWTAGDFDTYRSASTRGVAKLGLDGRLEPTWRVGDRLGGGIEWIDTDGAGGVYAGSQTPVQCDAEDARLAWRLTSSGTRDGNFECPSPVGIGADELIGLKCIGNYVGLLTWQTLRVLDAEGSTIWSRNGGQNFHALEEMCTGLVVTSRAFSVADSGVEQTYGGEADPLGVKLVAVVSGDQESAWQSGAGTGALMACGAPVVNKQETRVAVGTTLDYFGVDWTWNGAPAPQGLLLLTDSGTQVPGFDCTLTLSGVGMPVPFDFDAAGNLLFGGAVTSINGTPVMPGQLYSVNQSGVLVATWELFDDTVNDCKVLPDGTLAVGGKFTHYGSVVVNRFALVRPDGRLADDPWGGVDRDQLPAVLFEPPEGHASITQPVEVAMRVPRFSTATIRYERGGATPTGASPVYSTPITISGAETFQAFAEKDGWVDGPVSMAHYCGTLGDPKLPRVVFDPSSGPLPVTVSLSVPGHPSATIYFELDGAEPTEASAEYTGPIELTGSGVREIRAFAVEAGWIDSDISLARYFAEVQLLVNVNLSDGGPTMLGPAVVGVTEADLWHQSDIPSYGVSDPEFTQVLDYRGVDVGWTAYAGATDGEPPVPKLARWGTVDTGHIHPLLAQAWVAAADDVYESAGGPSSIVFTGANGLVDSNLQAPLLSSGIYDVYVYGYIPNDDIIESFFEPAEPGNHYEFQYSVFSNPLTGPGPGSSGLVTLSGTHAAWRDTDAFVEGLHYGKVRLTISGVEQVIVVSFGQGPQSLCGLQVVKVG